MAIQEIEPTFASLSNMEISAPYKSADISLRDLSILEEAKEYLNWPFNGIKFRPEQSTLTLDVNSPDLTESLVGKTKLTELAKNGFKPTSQPHITVINYGSGSNILKQLKQYSQAGQEIILRDILRIAGNQDWSWHPTGELHPFIGRSRGTLKLIAMVNCPGVTNFYREVEELIPGAEIERHPMHITLLKKAVDLDSSLEVSLEGLQLTRPLNSLGHLALGYDFEQKETLKPAVHQSIPWHVRHTLLRKLRIEPLDELVYSDEPLDLLVGMDELSLPLQKETMENISVDLHHLDILGAAALGRRVSLVPEALEHFLPGAGAPMSTPGYSPTEKAAVFDREMEISLEALESARATSQRVVTGAIVKIAQFFNNQRLLEEAERRISIDPTYYPARLKSIGNLNQLSSTLLKKMVSKPEGTSENALQTGVDAVQQAA